MSDILFTKQKKIEINNNLLAIKTPGEAQCVHRISLPAYAIEKKRWQSGVPKKKEMSLTFKNYASSLARRVTSRGSFSKLTRQ
jgi:hypothetical protein